MRSYGQYCEIAKALDVVGDRWALLIVRELLIQGPCRYTDLRNGLPGIATNLLADRLRDLENAGVLRRFEAPPPIATTLYELTARGSELAPVLDAFAAWGAGLMAPPRKDEVFKSHWLAVPVSRLTDSAPDGPPLTIQVHTGDEPMLVETVNGEVRARPGVAGHPDALLEGPPDVVIFVLRGWLDIAQARKRGLRFEGDVSAIRRLQPTPPTVRE